MESSTVMLGFPDKPKPWEYWPRGVNICRGALGAWGLLWVPKTTRRCPVWFYFFLQHTCTHVMLPERCWMESAGGINSSAVVVYKRVFATRKTRYQRKPAQLVGLKLGVGERCSRQWFRAQVSFLHYPSLSRRTLLSAECTASLKHWTTTLGRGLALGTPIFLILKLLRHAWKWRFYSVWTRWTRFFWP